MKLNKVMMATVLALGVSSTAFAAEQGHGKVTFTGSIIDAPCSINPESADQTVELGQISNVALKNGGKSNPRQFSIDLENCSFEADDKGVLQKNKVTATFTGMESSVVNGALSINGTAQGAGVVIAEADGNAVKLGQPTKAQVLQDNNNSLNFSAYLQGASASDTAIVPGDFKAVADFTLAYN
ncbi:fimbrial protein [Enterobacter sp. E12]|uniref:fimbrial protein n=1 Tax=Enterobacter TaxID=547 RepID=UPI00044C1577|nr:MULTISPECIES: fimbrial protein [Enterobacter]EUM08942.1 hypothetical protein L465_03034 [Enterobacter sp. BIDMC 29]MBD0817125.1 type 1 fimbrial protein [Enterobacter sp. E12]